MIILKIQSGVTALLLLVNPTLVFNFKIIIENAESMHTASKQWHHASLKRCFVLQFGAGYVQRVIQQYEPTTV